MMTKKNKLDCVVKKKTPVDLSNYKKKGEAIITKNKKKRY